MTILAVDTTGPVASVALSREGKIVYEAAANAGLTHSSIVQPMIDEAARVSRVAPGEIDLFACVAGPGSFTGVRIGVCCVKGMAVALGKPVVALDALEVLAMGKYGFDGVICPILDARRGQVYSAAFTFISGDRPERVLPDDAVPLGDYLSRLPGGKIMFVGDGVGVHRAAIEEAMGERAIIAPDHIAQLRAGAACALAVFEKPVSAVELEPLYLRKPQAEREREKRLNG
ncbi:MAG: tRNA (adenosine(37)-N6)-threonylcarbamoyltransferase complex dimerization subunit type 1 TsaB [Clostridia bacterium]|nr:tRNA (adenosine(37)-N6)-threonylcarbamoyltransferase complex dimerization subunit type 1 TsaB [Clostridia bacterium]